MLYLAIGAQWDQTLFNYDLHHDALIGEAIYKGCSVMCIIKQNK